MAKEILSEVNDRIISLIASFVDRGIYNSERDFLIKNGYQTSKLSEIKSQKTNFKLEDVRLILTIEPEVSADWIMTGKGSMYLAGDNNRSDYERLYWDMAKKYDLANEKVIELNNKLGEAQGELKAYKQLVSNQDTSQSSFSLGCKVAEDKIAYEREKK